MSTDITLWVHAPHYLSPRLVSVAVRAEDTFDRVTEVICQKFTNLVSSECKLYKFPVVDGKQSSTTPENRAPESQELFEFQGLKPRDTVGQYFSAKRPLDVDVFVVSTSDQQLQHLGKRARYEISSSDAAKLKKQNARDVRRLKIACNPHHHYPLPIAIYHPVFGQFKDLMANSPSDDELSQYYETTHSLLLQAEDSFILEDDPAAAMWPLLAKILVKQIKDRFDDKGSPAGCSAVALCGNIVTPIMMLECRENISSNANESGQRLLADARMAVHQQKIGEIRNVSCMPMFLVSIAGPHMMVQGSMLLDDELIVQPLTDYIYLGCGGPYHHQRIVRVAHVFHALRTCLDSLEVYYRDLVPSTQPDPAQCLPYLTSLPDSTKIEYIEPMMSKKPIFKARRVRDNRPVVVKFVDSYCEEAHRLLAEEGLAPALHHFGPVCPDLYMVVMDFEENIHDAYSMYGPHRLPKPVYTQVARAVNILHRHDFVFGDLRYCNIMVRQLPKADLKAGAFAIDDFDDEDADQVDSVLLLDFDWCGLADKARYPSTLNDAGTISWPEGVKRGGIMRKAHDLAMLESFKFAQFLEQPEQPCVGM